FLAFVHIDSDNSLIYSSYPQDHVIGYTPPGASIDPGGVEFAAQPFLTTMPDVRPLTLSATPDPVSSSSSGTTVLFTVEHALESHPGSGLVLGAVAFSTAQPQPMELSVLGAAGCTAQLGAFGVSLSFVGPVGAQVVS